MEWRNGNDTDPQMDQRIENLAMIIDEARGYRTPLEFLEMLSLQAAGDKGWGDDNVVISTVHAAKGLEFNCVYCPAMEEGVFPNARSEKTSFGADEERRLAHVAWTRARDELHISFAGYRMGGEGGGNRQDDIAQRPTSPFSLQSEGRLLPADSWMIEELPKRLNNSLRSDGDRDTGV